MKKMKLTRSLLAACSIVALSAVMYGCVHNGGDDEPEAPVVTPEPMPDPGPTDLDDTQAAAAAAETAAMTASTNAAASAKSAMDDTMYLATLQTGADANSKGTGGNEHAKAASDAADAAAAEYAKAKAAAAAAAAATTGAAGEAAWADARDARDAAQAAETMAATHAAAASKAAMSELQINGTVKSVGESMVDAGADASTSPHVPDTATVRTGFQGYLMRETVGAVAGVPHSAAGVTPVVAYKQAVAARNLRIGKTLDTTDDKNRLVVVHARAGSKSARVYAEIPDGTPADLSIRTTDDGDSYEIAEDGTVTVGTTPVAPTLTPLGMYYEATQTALVDDSDTSPLDESAGEDADGLDHGDVVAATTEGKAVFSYADVDGDGTVTTRYVIVQDEDLIVDGNSHVNYQHVDVTAAAAPDSPDSDGLLQSVQVKASIPMAKEYSHIHFGVWAGLGDAPKTGAQKLTGLGIGFVQNISDSGVTDRQGIGTAIYNGDWVAVVQRQNSAGAGAFNIRDGAATMTADFDEDEFTAALTGLATLEGTLANNGFSGTKATVDRTSVDLDSDAKFTGEFSGGIYGPKGTEAAGVFDFAGGEAGSFRGAFGGTNQE